MGKEDMVCKYIVPKICLLKQTPVEKSKYFLVCYLAVETETLKRETAIIKT